MPEPHERPVNGRTVRRWLSDCSHRRSTLLRLSRHWRHDVSNTPPAWPDSHALDPVSAHELPAIVAAHDAYLATPARRPPRLPQVPRPVRPRPLRVPAGRGRSLRSHAAGMQDGACRPAGRQPVRRRPDARRSHRGGVGRCRHARGRDERCQAGPHRPHAGGSARGRADDGIRRRYASDAERDGRRRCSGPRSSRPGWNGRSCRTRSSARPICATPISTARCWCGPTSPRPIFAAATCVGPT